MPTLDSSHELALFNDFAVKISVAKGAANRLTRDRADHEKRDERELVGHLEYNKNRSNWCPHHGSQACTHSNYCESNPIVHLQVQHESTKVSEDKTDCGAKEKRG